MRPPQNRPTCLRDPSFAAAVCALLAALLLLAGGAVAEDTPLPENLLDPQTIEPISAAQFQQVLDAHRGEVVLVNLWATWCIPCLQELPELNELQERYEERGLKVIAVSLDGQEKLERAREFFAERAPDLISYLSSEDDDWDFVSPITEDWLGALPTSFFFHRDGSLSEVITGRVLFKTFAEKVLPLLKEEAPAL